jgi:hypothetical protein
MEIEPMAKRFLVAAAIALLGHGAALAEPFFEFGDIPGVPSEPNVEVNLNATLLAFVVEATKNTDADARAALAGIEGIRVRVYDKVEDPAAVARFVDDTSKALEHAGWQRMIYVRDDADRVRIHVKMNDGKMTGMTVIVVDESEAVFINIAGSIDPAELGRLARVMGVGDVLGGAHRGNVTGRRHEPPSSNAAAEARDER